MIDITKEEFWDARYEETHKTQKKENKIIDLIKKNKIITGFLVIFSLLTIANVILIYNFLSILNNL